MASAEPAPQAAPSGDIVLRTPSKYATPASSSSDSASASAPFAAPPSDWLARTWSVTHSTLSMWQSAQNVRISYRTLPDDASGRPRNEDRVEYESNKPSSSSSSSGGSEAPKKVKSVEGVNTASVARDGTFDWRGKSWLFFVTSHWEILGWGERPVAGGKPGEVERWAVTWFAPTFFTKEGIDIYCDRREGVSAETLAAIQTAMTTTVQWPTPLATLAKGLLPVDINLPWSE